MKLNRLLQGFTGPQIIQTDSVIRVPTISVTLAPKWSCLYLIAAGGQEVAELPFPDPAHFSGSPYIDHVPNPRAVLAYAKQHNYLIDDLAWELMIGRWETIVEGPGARAAPWAAISALRDAHESALFDEALQQEERTPK